MSVWRLAALFCLATGSANADDFAERCGELSRNARVSVTFNEGPVSTDASQGMQALNGLAGKRAFDHHNVYGLTHAKPYLRVNAIAQIVPGSNGVCALPDLAIDLGYSEMTVYLASEIGDRCRREIIREHEQEHVNTWKAHLRASAQLLKTALLRELGEARIYASRDEAEAGIRAWAQALVAPWAKRLVDSVVEAQRAIDTPTSYAAVASRLRSCRPSR